MSVAQKNPALYLKPTFNQVLIDQYTPMIHMMIKKNVYGWDSSDVCYEWQDMFQDCLIHLNEAVEKFDESKGMKFSNFLYMVFNSRLGNFRTKISKHNFKTINFTDLINKVGNDCEDFGVDSLMDYITKTNESIMMEDIQNQIIDANMAYNRMSEERQVVYKDHFIMGKTVSEICAEQTEMKSHAVRRQMKSLTKIHATLVEGQI